MRRYLMTSTLLIAATLAGCSQGDAPAGEITDVPSAAVAPLATNSASATPAPAASATPTPFTAALPGPTDKDPQALLAYWKGAIEAGDYAAAGKAWRSGTTPATMPTGTDPVVVTFGPGQTEGAAGSLYFTAPVTVTVQRPGGDPTPVAGTLTARRVNDVEGATAEQLSWRIVSIDWN